MKEIFNKIIVDFYLNSRDFNGIQINALLKKTGKTWGEAKVFIKELIEEDLIEVIDEITGVNPNIIRIGFEPKINQIQKLDLDKPSYMCLYPSRTHLKNIINTDNYINEPYKLRLALGEPQLSYVSFNLSVLEYYRNDPRYKYTNDDIQGEIYLNEEDLDGNNLYLKTFGYAYDKNFNRAVAVFLSYIKNLSPNEQLIWRANELPQKYKLHPDYYKNSILGDWGDRIPICDAILQEIYIINRMSEAMGRPTLFRKDYGEYGNDKPKKFHFLIRPTLEEFNSFILLLDKMLSDNINKKFFMDEVEYENEQERPDGKINVSQKGTLVLLDEWIRKYFRTNDWSIWEKAIASFRKVRKLRQNPAHSIDEDKFDQQYFKDQRELIIEAYDGIRTIRLMFANHPKVKTANIKISKELFKGEIWDF